RGCYYRTVQATRLVLQAASLYRFDNDDLSVVNPVLLPGSPDGGSGYRASSIWSDASTMRAQHRHRARANSICWWWEGVSMAPLIHGGLRYLEYQEFRGGIESEPNPA